jgi:hypothetical protein
MRTDDAVVPPSNPLAFATTYTTFPDVLTTCLV